MMNTMSDLMNPRRYTIGVTTFLLALVVAAGMSGCGEPPAAPDTTVESDGTILKSDQVSEEEAEEVRANARKNQSVRIVAQPADILSFLQRLFDKAEILGINLDYDRTDLKYECLIREGKKVYIVVVDPEKGMVIDKREINDSSVTYTTTINVITNISITVNQACERGRGVAPGDVVEANLEVIEGKATYIIVILTSENRYITLFIDAKSGKERKLKECEDKDDDDDKHKGHDHECDDDDHHHHHKHKKGRGHYRHGKGKGYGHYHHHHHCHCD